MARKIHKGPRGGRYILKNGRKTYVKKVKQRAFGDTLNMVKNKASAIKDNLQEMTSNMTPDMDIWKVYMDIPKVYMDIRKVYSDNEKRMQHRKNTIDMSEDELMYAKMSQAAYRYVDQTHDVELAGHTLLTDFSDDKSIVYANKNKTHIVIAYRGTIPTKYSDLVADVYITFGKTDKSNRFKDAMNKYTTVQNNYPKATIVTTGHSLGGSQAIYVAKNTGVDCWAFNPGQGVSKEYLNDVDKFSNIHTMHIENDPISDTAGLENIAGIVIFPAVSNNPLKNHSLDNFIKK